MADELRSDPLPGGQRVAFSFAYLALHLGLAATNLVDASAYRFGPPWNPEVGLAFALLLVGGRTNLPLVALAGALTGLIVHHLSAFAAVGEGLALAGLYGASAHVLAAHPTHPASPRSLQEVVRLLVGGAVAAGLHALFVLAVADRHGADPGSLYLRQMAGDILGIVVVTPFLLLHVREWRVPRPDLANLAEGAAIALVLWIDFGLHASQKFRFFYLLIMPLVWIAVRHGLKGASAGILLAQAGVLAAVALVPFRDPSLTLLQFIMLTLSVTTLLLGAVVSEQRRSQAAIKDSETRLDTIVRTAPDCVMTIGESGLVESANPACERLFGRGGTLLVGHPAVEFLPDFRAGTPESMALDAEGRPFPVEVSLDAAHLSDRRLTVAVVRDIRQRKATEARRWEHQANLANAVRLSASERLAAALAHQLNQPLASVVGYTRAAQRMMRGGTEAQETITEAMDKAVAQAERATLVIRHTRDFLSSGEMPRIPARVPEILEEAQRLLAAHYAIHEVTLAADFPDDLPPVLVDPIQVEQVLVNLLQNAMDAIVLGPATRRAVVCTATAVDSAWVRVTVRDGGPGVPAALLERLFTPFTTGKPKGMGMGLFIANSIVEAHGGTMRAESSPEGGAAFSFTLPVASSSHDGTP